jgi:hypothetical protein
MSSIEPVEITPVLQTSSDPLQQLSQCAQSLGVEQRQQCAATLQSITTQMTTAEQLWQDNLDNPTHSDDRFTAVMWIGAERARALHRVHLDLRDLARTLTTQGGVSFRDTVGIASEVDIVTAYDQLKPDETGPQRAEQAITTIVARRQQIEQLIGALSH